jgi:TPR repeat protein
MNIEQKYNKALEFYQDEKDLDGVNLLLEIVDEFKDDSFLDEVYLLLGQIYSNPSRKKNKNIQKGIDFLQKSIELGSGEAARELANLYYFGDDIKADFNKSEEYWQIGIRLGDSISGLELLNLYFDEKFDNNDEKLKIIEWLIKNGDFKGSALFKLSKLYKNNDYQLYDFDKYLKVLNEGCELGNINCCMELVELYFKGKQVSKDLNLCLKYIGNLDQDDYIFKDDIKAIKQKISKEIEQ